MHTNFTSLTEKIQKLESANSSLKIEIEGYAKREKLWTSEKAALVKDLASSKEMRSVVEKDLAVLKAAQTQNMTDTLALQNELKRCQEELTRATRSGSSATDDLKAQLERAQAANDAKIAELQKSLENTRAALEKEKGNSEKLRGERDDSRKQFADKDAEYKTGVLTAKQKESECLLHMNKMRDLQADIDRLNAALAGAKAGDKSGELERIKVALADANRQLSDARREVVL
jgi:chromosome segregation ATPase